jgi:hypothetical protein
MLTERCHICLEDIEYTPIKIIKECCDAFICNTCWLQVRNDESTFQCPICKRNFCKKTTDVQLETSVLDDYRCILNKLSFILKALLIGYSFTIIFLLIAHNGNIDVCIRDIKYMGKTFHFWIIIPFYGYLIKVFIQWCFESICKCFS